MALHRARQLDAVMMFGMKEVGADEEENEVGAIEPEIGDSSDLLTEADLVRAPGVDQPAVLERGQMLLEGLELRFIGGGVGDEDVDGHDPSEFVGLDIKEPACDWPPPYRKGELRCKKSRRRLITPYYANPESTRKTPGRCGEPPKGLSAVKIKRSAPSLSWPRSSPPSSVSSSALLCPRCSPLPLCPAVRFEARRRPDRRRPPRRGPMR